MMVFHKKKIMVSGILVIENMGCDCCISEIEEILGDLEINFKEVKMGRVILDGEISDEKFEELRKCFKEVGHSILNK
jgi:hypothetical protein